MAYDTINLLETIAQAPSFSALRAAACLPEPDGDEGYFFVSYSHADYKAVLPDIIRLKEAGLGIWYDRGLESGKSWLGEVRKKMSSYDCRGILFYLSESFLASPSCMQELFHYLTTADRSCLLLVLDGDRKGLSERLREAVRRHADEGACPGMLAALATAIEKNPILPITATTADKLKRTKRFSPPALLTYGRAVGDAQVALLQLGSVSVTGVLDKNVRSVKIPRYAVVNGRLRPVRGIAAGAFFGCDLLEEVVMPRFCYVEHAAFVRCPSLRRVLLWRPARLFGILPLGLIGDVFEACPSATLEVGRGSTIYASSFRRRTDLTEMALPRRQYFAADAFAGCTSLTSVSIKKRDQCSPRTFAECRALTAARIPSDNVTRKLIGTFDGCTALATVSLPRRLSAIGENAFRSCAALTAITLPPHVKEIHDTAFSGCTALREVSLLGRTDRFLENTPYRRRQALDRLFPHAERFYLKKRPLLPPFDGEFCERPSDRRGFILYVREGAK